MSVEDVSVPLRSIGEEHKVFQSCHPAESKFTPVNLQTISSRLLLRLCPLLAATPVRSGNGAPQVFQFIKESACLEKQFSRKLKLSRRISGADSPEG